MKDNALKIVRILKKAGFQAVFAGGSVRDMLLGLEPHDIDIATNATPEIVEKLLDCYVDSIIPVGKSFGVIVAIIDKQQFEIATFRSDGKYSDNRRPDSVKFSTIEDDAKRRDFTINGMFFDPISEEVIDLVGGKNDLEDGVIRFIGDPEERINEDKLRIMRGVRFATKFDFAIDARSYAAIKRHAHEINQISVERIFEEFVKSLHLRNKRKLFSLLFDTKIIDEIFPEIKAMEGVEQPKDYHPEGDVFQHILLGLEKLPEDASTELLLATLFHDVGKPKRMSFRERIRFDGHDTKSAKMVEEILTRMKTSNELIDSVSSLVANHMKFMHVQKMRISKLKRFMRMDNFDEHMALHTADCLASHGDLKNIVFLKEKLESDFVEPEKLKPVRIITGHDLISMGFKQGPVFKEILEKVEDEQLEGRISTSEEAIEFVKNNYTL